MKNESEQKLVIYWNTKKVISLICAILIIPTIIVFIFSWTLKQTIINPEYYKNNFKKVDAASRLINKGIPALILESSFSQDELKDTLTKDLIVLVIQKTIDPAWIDGLVNKTIDQIVVFFSQASQTGDKINIDLSDTSSFLNKVSDGLIILEQVIPSCSEAQSSPDASKIAGSLDCKKTDMNLDEMKTQIAKTRTKINNINLGVIDVNQQVSQANSYILFIQKFIYEINTAFYVSLIILIILISLIVGLEYKNLTFLAKTISLPLAIGSFVGLVIMWLIKPLSVNNINLINLDLPKEMKLIIVDILKANIAGIFQKFELIAGIILGLFLVIYILTLVLEKKKIFK